MRKVQGIMHISQTTFTTEARDLVYMFQCYSDIWPRKSHVLAPLTEGASGPIYRKIIWNNELESNFK